MIQSRKPRNRSSAVDLDPRAGLMFDVREIPVEGPDEVERPRVVEAFSSIPGVGLTVLSAPPGFGKTIGLAQWARGRGATTAWLTLDDLHNDPHRFLRSLVECLRTAQPIPQETHLGDFCNRLLDLPEPPPDSLLLERLLEDLDTTEETLVLILDDFHVIVEPRVHAAVQFLAQHSRGQLSIVVATRQPMPFPLGKFRLEGRLLERDGGFLRFTDEETRLFLSRNSNRAWSPVTIAALLDKTDGWIAGLKLMLLSLSADADVTEIEAIDHGAKPLEEYIVEEVLRRADPDTQRFLRQISVLDQIEASLCEAVTGEAQSRARLRELEDENLFVIAVDSQRRWYRLQSLFRDFLRVQVEVNEPEMARLLHRRAAGWYEQRGSWTQALSHAIRGEDWDRVAQLMGVVDVDLLAHGRAGPVSHWLERIPASIRDHDFGMSLTYAWAHLLTGRLDRVEPALARVQALSTRAEANERQAEVEVLAAHVERFRGEPSRAIELARSALQRLEQTDHPVRAMASLAEGIALGIVNKTRESCSVLERSIMEAERVDADFIWFAASNVLANQEFSLGRIDRARERMEHALAKAGNLPDRQIIETHVVLGLVNRERMNSSEAEHHFRLAIQLAEDRGVHPLWCHADIALARLDRHRGRIERARERMDFALDLIQKSGYSKAVATVRAWQARLALEAGDLRRARSWLADHDLDARPVSTSIRELVRARVLLASGQASELVERLGAALTIAEAEERLDMQVELLLLLSRAQLTLENASEAQRSLRRAIELAAIPRYVWTFVEELSSLEQPIRNAAAHLSDPADQSFVAEVLAASPIQTESRPQIPLSEREQEVLSQLSSGRTNAEIAAVLYISTNTVKTHLRKIFEKLGARSRVQALQIARESGWVA